MNQHEHIEVNANNLIAMGKEAWLKRRKLAVVPNMTQQQQDYQVRVIENKLHRGDNVKPWKRKVLKSKH